MGIPNARSYSPVEAFTRPNTNVSVIGGLIENGSVVQRFLPGINNQGVQSLPRIGAAITGALAGAATEAVIPSKP